MKERLHKKEKEHINTKLIDCKAAGFGLCVVADVALDKLMIYLLL